MKLALPKVVPSILSADFRHLEREVKSAEQAGADMIHCDIMDGHFVPHITFGSLIVEFVKKCVSIPLDVHLMVSHPEQHISNFSQAGADILTIHAESCQDLGAIIEQIKESGSKVGVTVNPDIAIEPIIPWLEKIDQVLIMTVNAGYAGQKFIPETIAKIYTIYNESVKLNHPVAIEVDGGITDTTAEICAEKGATIFVAGSYIFNQSNYRQPIEAIRHSAEQGLKKLGHEQNKTG